MIAAEHPWEKRISAYHLVLHDGEKWRMYYPCGGEVDLHQGGWGFAGYAESDDGIEWRKPSLGIIDFEGSKDNNLVYGGPGTEMAQFLDANPECKENERYKAVVRCKRTEGRERAMYALASPDGLRWHEMSDRPVLTRTPDG